MSECQYDPLNIDFGIAWCVNPEHASYGLHNILTQDEVDGELNTEEKANES